ncbi:BlaI/MecI/CopY family transcriptional regulator [Nocardioides sp. NPDC101246]|uniref:BlaI/MecI/CopY family transcriptional regulator n=1 Tax=Nocardioides sp. NPDC101246 TaxID=3364336 RepID=UPI00381FD2A4
MRGLGPLEATIMQRMWSGDAPQTVRAVHDSLAEDRKIAYTTVMTVMDNLHRKGFLGRERQGRAYVYSPSTTREEHTASLLGEVLADGGDRANVLLHFVEHLDADELEALRRVVTDPDRSPHQDGSR